MSEPKTVMVLTRWVDRDPFVQYEKALKYDWSGTNVTPILAYHGKGDLDQPGQESNWEKWDLRGKTDGSFPPFQNQVFQYAFKEGYVDDAQWLSLIDDDCYYRDPAQVQDRVNEVDGLGYGAWGPTSPFIEGFWHSAGHPKDCVDWHPVGRSWATFGSQFYSVEALKATRKCWSQDLDKIQWRADVYQFLLMDDAGYEVARTHLRHVHRNSNGALKRLKPKPDASADEWRTYFNIQSVGKTLDDFDRYQHRFPARRGDIISMVRQEYRMWNREAAKNEELLRATGVELV